MEDLYERKDEGKKGRRSRGPEAEEEKEADEEEDEEKLGTVCFRPTEVPFWQRLNV